MLDQSHKERYNDSKTTKERYKVLVHPNPMRNEVLKGATHEGVLRLVTPRGGLDLLVEWIHGAKLTNVYQILYYPSK